MLTEGWIKRPHTDDEIRQLIEIVQTLKQPDMTIDARVAFAFGWTHSCDTSRWGIGAPHWYFNHRSIGEMLTPFHLHSDMARLPNFTSSIDVASVLIPEGLNATIIGYRNQVSLTDEEGKSYLPDIYELSTAENVPCAIVAASLKAFLIYRDEGHHLISN